MKKQAAIGFIFVTVLIDIIGIGIIIPVLPGLIAELSGGTISDASLYGGLFMFVYAFFQFLFSPILGGLSDQFGRRKVLLIALFGLGIDYLFLGFAPTIGWLFVGRMISGICGGSVTTANAYIADITDAEHRAKNFGMLGAAFGLGFIVGPSLGGLLAEYGTRVPFFVSAGLTLVNWLYGYVILPESLRPENRRKFSWKRANPIGTLRQLNRNAVIIGLVIAMFVVFIAAHATHTTWTYFTMEKFGWSAKDVGLSLGFVGIMVSIIQAGLVRSITRRFGSEKTLYLGLIFNAIGLGLIALATQSWMLYAIIVPYAVGGLAGPSLQGLLTSRVPASEQGELQGGIQSVISLTSIIGPLIMSNVFFFFTRPDEWYFPGAPYALGSLLAIASLIIAYRTLRQRVEL